MNHMYRLEFCYENSQADVSQERSLSEFKLFTLVFGQISKSKQYQSRSDFTRIAIPLLPFYHLMVGKSLNFRIDMVSGR